MSWQSRDTAVVLPPHVYLTSYSIHSILNIDTVHHQSMDKPSHHLQVPRAHVTDRAGACCCCCCCGGGSLVGVEKVSCERWAPRG